MTKTKTMTKPLRLTAIELVALREVLQDCGLTYSTILEAEKGREYGWAVATAFNKIKGALC